MAPTLLAVKSFVDYVYPNKIKTAVVQISWNALDLCSKMEIYATHIYTTYFQTLLPQKKQEDMIRIICDGDEIAYHPFSEFIKIKDDIKLSYDFILYEIPIFPQTKYEKYKRYVLRYDNIKDVLKVEYNSLKCFELNTIEITINQSDRHSIDLGRNQYMVNGNVLFDRAFLKWYLNIYYNITLWDEDKYTVSFIDHHMNYIFLPDYCYILIKKNNYEIVNIVNDT
jgi:hypothetical protein